MEYLLIFGIVAAISGGIGFAIGDLRGKNNGQLGFILGLLLGPLGWIIVAVMPAGEPEEFPGVNKPAETPEQARIRELENTLTQLKRNAAQKAASVSEKKPARKSTVGETDERGVPTYKLD